MRSGLVARLVSGAKKRHLFHRFEVGQPDRLTAKPAGVACKRNNLEINAYSYAFPLTPAF